MPSPVAITKTSQPSEQLSSVARDFKILVGQLTKNQMYTSAAKVEDGRASAKDTEEIVDTVREIFSAYGDFENSYEEGKDRCAAILARRGDVMRDIDRSQTIMAWQNNEESQSVLSQPLDAASEEKQRNVASLAFSLHRQMETLRDRLKIQENLATGEAGQKLAAVRLESYNRIKAFDESTKHSGRRVDELLAAIQARPPTGPQTTALTQRAGASNQLLRGSGRGAESLQSFVSMGPSAFASLAPPPVSSFSFVDAMGVGSASVTGAPKESSRRMVAPPSAARKATPIFSPPQSRKPREHWDVSTSVDQVKARQLSFASPLGLKERTVDEAAQGALSKFGTSPEKLTGYGETQRDPPQQSGMAKSASAASLALKGQERRTQPENSSFTAPLSASSSSPPRASSSISDGKPKPSTAATQASAPAGGAKSPENSFTASSGSKDEGKASSSSFGLGDPAPGKAENRSTAATFGSGGDGLAGMSLLGSSSLFATAPAPGEVGGKDESTGASGDSKSPDYRKILTEFYKTIQLEGKLSNAELQTKLSSIDQNLKKYQVSTEAISP